MTGVRQRQPRIVDPAYKAWIAKAPCIACLSLNGRAKLGVHVAHLRMGSLEDDKRPTGMGEKPSDIWCTPLCPDHHLNGEQAQHKVGETHFWVHLLGINPFAFCKALRAAYEAGKGADLVVADYAARGRQARGPDA